MEKILRTNMSSGHVSQEAVPEQYQTLGGRGLTSRIVFDEVPPNCDPLGPQNKLIIAPGLLGGTTMSSASRLSVGGKSPLTGGIKESNAGGTAAGALARLGIKAIIVEGESLEDHCQYLYISKSAMELRPADFAFKGVYSSTRLLLDRYGDKVSIILIGPAGEQGFPTAGVTNTDPEGRPSRYSGRGGLGAVMGIKGLKAIVLDTSEAPGINYQDKNSFRETVKELTKLLKENPQTGEGYAKYGTAAMASRTNALKGLPTRNFSQGSFECEPFINGEYLYQITTARGGEGTPTHSCMPGCIIRCSNVYADAQGREVVGPLEYETIGLMGSNCGIGNLDDIARLNYICNDLGVDTIEMGATIAVLMDQGVLSFGDAAAVEELLEEIRRSTLMGRVIAQGALITGKVFGSRRIPVVKGQAMAAYDPRAIKGTGTTYATSPMGADHTAGNTIRADIDHTDPSPQAGLSKKVQGLSTLADCLGLCLFALPAVGGNMEKIGQMVQQLHGQKTTKESLLKMAQETLSLERTFNHKAGLGPGTDRLPEFMTREELPGLPSVFDVPEEELDSLHEE